MTGYIVPIRFSLQGKLDHQAAQKGSTAGTNSMGTSGINGLSHSAQYFIPACSDKTWPMTIKAFFFPEEIASCAYSTTSHSRVSPTIKTSMSGRASNGMPGNWLTYPQLAMAFVIDKFGSPSTRMVRGF